MGGFKKFFEGVLGEIKNRWLFASFRGLGRFQEVHGRFFERVLEGCSGWGVVWMRGELTLVLKICFFHLFSWWKSL